MAVSFDLAALEVRQREAPLLGRKNLLTTRREERKERKQNVQQMWRPRYGGNKSKDALRAGKGGERGLYKDLAQALHRGLCPRRALKAGVSRASPKDSVLQTEWGRGSFVYRL